MKTRRRTSWSVYTALAVVAVLCACGFIVIENSPTEAAAWLCVALLAAIVADIKELKG